MKKMFKAWRQASGQLENVLPEDDFDTWIAPILYSHHEKSEVYFSVPSLSMKKWLDHHYMKALITASLRKASGRALSVHFFVRDYEESQTPYISCQKEITTLNPKYMSFLQND